MHLPPPMPLEIFVSYSHHDSAWRARLFDDYIATTLGDCRVWTDAQLRAGDRWQDEITLRLQRASVAVLLVSPRYLQSRFIRERELPAILARAQDPKAALRVVWIPIAIDRAALAQRPELLGIQAASSFDDVLPDQPAACPDGQVERARNHVRQQLMTAVDPVGAELAQQVARRYELGPCIGAGNRAAVYKARDRVLQRTVAIKVNRNKDQRAAFMSDVHDAIRMSEEPNFINVYDAATDDALAYCVIQHVPGQTLRGLLREHPGGLPLSTLRNILLRVGQAIASAHALGVTYGNLKPSNILLNDAAEPFILPVGRRRDRALDMQRVVALLARIAQARADGRAPTDSDSEDLAYLVPDHFGDQFEPVDARLADQYMLGLLAHELITGRLPQALPDPARLWRDGRAAFATLAPVNATRRLCPQRISDGVARMVSRMPSRRFAGLPEVLAEPDLQGDLGLVLARDSYRRCAAQPGFDTDFFKRFYDDFARRCPAAQPYLQPFAAAGWARQYRMLKEAVLLLLAFRQQNDGQLEPNVLSRIADSHAAIPAWAYAPFLDALLAVVCGDPATGLAPFDPECADPGSRDKLDELWRSALAPGMAYLQSRAGRVAGA